MSSFSIGTSMRCFLIATGIATMNIISTNTIHKIRRANPMRTGMCIHRSGICTRITRMRITSITIDTLNRDQNLGEAAQAALLPRLRGGQITYQQHPCFSLFAESSLQHSL